jgi:methionyl aminopeptidase
MGYTVGDRNSQVVTKFFRETLLKILKPTMLQPDSQTRKLLLGFEGREKMRAAGRFNAELMDEVRKVVKPGISTAKIDNLVHEYTLDHGHTPATLGYMGFPKSCCTSINEVICHGIPDAQVLREGDIINVDLTSIVNGWFGDQSETFILGPATSEAIDVTQAAFDCLYLGIDALTPGCPVSAIGDAIVKEAHRRGFSVVREYVGHGLGQVFHQPPNIPHFPDRKSRQQRLLPGMCFTVEPMINAGTRFTRLDKHDGWTVRTRDLRLSAQFEHTILMTEEGPEVLTLTKDGPQKGHRFS